jgi:hypothetical protein
LSVNERKEINMASHADDGGELSANSLYTLADFQRRLNLSTSAWQALRRKGLPFRKIGKRVFILGADVIDFFRSFGNT